MIVRPDGSPLYNFASVVDDATMEITHVVRAEEHLSNTFPQLLIFEALGAPLPAFAHVPYVAEPGSKEKMSKRKTEDYAKRGVLVSCTSTSRRATCPRRCSTTWPAWAGASTARRRSSPGAELIEKFTLDRVNSSPASHDPDKLFWIEGEWMKELPLDKKVAGVVPFLAAEGLRRRAARPTPTGAESRPSILALGDRLKVFSDVLKLGRYFFTPELTFEPGRRQEAAPQAGRPGDARRARRLARRRSSPTTWRPSKRPSTSTPRRPAARWATWSTRCGWRRPARGSARGSTIACSSSAATTCRARIRQTLAMLEQTD